MRSMIPIAIVALAGACRGREAGEQQTVPGMGKMPRMEGMAMRSDSLMPLMRAHFDSLAATPAQLAASMLTTHEGMAFQMLDAMGSDMRMMNMAADTGWTALSDSIRRDLAQLPALSGNGLETRLRAHAERIRRLQQHR